MTPNMLFFFLNHQIVYDEGPLYVFAKSEDIRSRWIKTLKDSQCNDSDVRFRSFWVNVRVKSSA